VSEYPHYAGHSLLEEVADLQSKLAVCEKDNKRLSDKAYAQAENCERLEQANIAKSGSIERLQAHCKNLESTIQDILTGNSAEIARFQAQLAACEKALEAANQRADKWHDSQNAAADALAACEKEREELKEELHDALHNAALTNKIAALTKEREELRLEAEKWHAHAIALFWSGAADDKTSGELHAESDRIRAMFKEREELRTVLRGIYNTPPKLAEARDQPQEWWVELVDDMMEQAGSVLLTK
jgi:chromosome segregation ATPase